MFRLKPRAILIQSLFRSYLKHLNLRRRCQRRRRLRRRCQRRRRRRHRCHRHPKTSSSLGQRLEMSFHAFVEAV